MKSAEERLRDNLDEILPGISNRAENVLISPPEIGEKVLRMVVEWACLAQNPDAILAGRKVASFLPRNWVKEKIFPILEQNLNMEDDYVFCRGAELLELIDIKLMLEFCKKGLLSKSEYVRDFANDFLQAYNPASDR